MAKKWMVALVFSGLVNSVGVYAQPEKSASRAELLYSTHCIACHNADIHWRDKKIAKDWASLRAEVGRWQGIAGLGWRDDDITGVASYLNARFYRYPEPVGKSKPAAKESHPPTSLDSASSKQDQPHR